MGVGQSISSAIFFKRSQILFGSKEGGQGGGGGVYNETAEPATNLLEVCFYFHLLLLFLTQTCFTCLTFFRIAK